MSKEDLTNPYEEKARIYLTALYKAQDKKSDDVFEREVRKLAQDLKRDDEKTPINSPAPKEAKQLYKEKSRCNNCNIL